MPGRQGLTRPSAQKEGRRDDSHPTGWHRGLACRLPALQSPGCSWWGGRQGSTPHQHPRPSWGRADVGEKTLWAVHYTGFAEMSPLSHTPGPSPNHLSSRGLPPTHVPPQQGLPEGWEDTVIVVPGGRQVGPARVGGVQTPRSLSHEGKWGQGISEGSLPSEEPVLGSAEGDPEQEASSNSIAAGRARQKQRPREKGLPQGSKRVGVGARGLR